MTSHPLSRISPKSRPAVFGILLAITLFIMLIAHDLDGTPVKILNLLAWSQWLAALLDALENSALTVMLFGQPSAPWPQIAYWSAVIKFALVILGILVTLGGAALYRLRS